MRPTDPHQAAGGRALAPAWCVAVAVAVGVRGWNALAGPRMWGYDAWGHVAYVLFLDLYRGVPWADQGWSYFHPPLHYALGFLLAQAGSGEVLMRGLAILGSVASLGTAAIGAWLVRQVVPERPWLPLLAFCAVAFVPVHLFMSPMPGNELTLTFLGSLAIAVHVAGERRESPSLPLDAATGGLLGLSLLTKFNGLVPLAAICGAVLLRGAAGRGAALLAGVLRAGLRAGVLRAGLIAGVALLVSAPYYARNVAAFGNPFELSRGYALVMSVEGDQPPGRRTWRDYVSLPLAMFENPNPLAPHLQHSIWGTVYLAVWADIFRESDVERALVVERRRHRSTTAMALLGLFPTALFAGGAVLATRDALRGRRREVYVPLLLLAAATLGAFAIFAWRVPIWSALKSSYLLGLSLPYAAFLARSFEPVLASRVGWLRLFFPIAFAGVCGAAVWTGVEGAVLERRADAPAAGAVRFYFGEYEEARRIYGRLVAGAGYKAAWLDNLAAVDLADGHPNRARKLYRRAVETGLPDPYRPGRLAVATALDGDLATARVLLDAALVEERLPELLANRGAIRAAEGDVEGALGDLAAATEAAPAMAPAWINLAGTLARAGRSDEAGRARERAVTEACRAPRGYPYGLGTGEVLEWGVGRRWLLLLEDPTRDPEGGTGLSVAMPAWYRAACAALSRRAST